jgi:integrase
MQEASRRETELQALVDGGVAVARPRPSRQLTVAQLVEKHIAWVQENRSENLRKQRKSLLGTFCAHVVTPGPIGAGTSIGELLAKVVAPDHVTQFVSSRAGGSDVTLLAFRIAIKAAWNWASDEGVLPKDFRPMADLRRGRAPLRDLTEVDLPTAAELKAITRWAGVATSKLRAGTGRWRKRLPDEFFGSVECRSFADMMEVYHATGARTGELCDVRVRDFMPTTKQLCLGKHKRTRTQTNPTIRNIQLGDKALAAVVRNVADKSPGDYLFTRENGAGWTQNDVNRRFRSVRAIAAEHKQQIRTHITPYSFRHLYISELLMIGTPVFQVAKMAGTSATEIERTYGHFFNRDLAAVQKRLDRQRAKNVGEDKGESRPHPGKR